MKAVILAGGLGTRLSEETGTRPKPMVEIGGKPILWHIMKSYSMHGISEFVVCCGYKGNYIKDYFLNFYNQMSDITVDLKNNNTTVHKKTQEDWKVSLVDTGLNTMTGGRLLAVSSYIPDDEPFCFTYGDGVSNINISKTVEFHRSHGKPATMSVSVPRARFGTVKMKGDQVTKFIEKPDDEGGYVNSGFFVLNKSVLSLIENSQVSWENEPLQTLSESSNLMAYKHTGFWQPMDTLRDKEILNKMWIDNAAPWKTW